MLQKSSLERPLFWHNTPWAIHTVLLWKAQGHSRSLAVLD